MSSQEAIGDGGKLAPDVAVELIAVLAAVSEAQPLAMTIDDGRALPSGPLEVGHRSLQSGLRAWVERQTRHQLGYTEQLYTFADPNRSGGITVTRPPLPFSRRRLCERRGLSVKHGRQQKG